MITYIGTPRRYTSPFYKRLWTDKSDDIKYIELLRDIDAYLERFINWLLKPFSGNFIHIHDYDAWSADVTLAYIIHPTLVKLRKHKQGAPRVDNDDVPEHLRATPAQIKQYEYDGTTDDNYFNRYDYVLDEMIWAFDFIIKEDTSIFTDDVTEKWNRANNGLRLFGKYYASLWD